MLGRPLHVDTKSPFRPRYRLSYINLDGKVSEFRVFYENAFYANFFPLTDQTLDLAA